MTSLYSLISSSYFLVTSLGFSICNTCHLQTERGLLLFIQSGFHLILFSSLFAVARISKTMLNNSAYSGHLCLIPDLKGNGFNFSLFRIMLGVSLLYMAFITL